LAKGPEAFRSISEAAAELGAPQHVLRFWETKFSFIRPMKRAGGRRFYRPYDIAVLAEVRRLLHEEGYTIKGVQKLHRELGAKHFLDRSIARPPPSDEPDEGPDAASPTELNDASRRNLREALTALEAAKARLDRLLGN
jgi:DNA-binding transcriptional MerR regulator